MVDQPTDPGRDSDFTERESAGQEHETRRTTGMGNPGTFERETPREPAAANGAGHDTGTTHETRRATGMGVPGTFPEEGGPVDRARRMASGRLEETAHRVRSLGDQAASKNKILGRTRPLAYTAADSFDSAADYVRTRELDEMRTDLETQVRRHPLASVAVAFFAGYTLRRLF